MSELRLNAEEQEMTLKSETEKLEALKKRTNDVHNLNEILIKSSQVQSGSVILVKLYY
jgi:hypothetical protein